MDQTLWNNCYGSNVMGQCHESTVIDRMLWITCNGSNVMDNMLWIDGGGSNAGNKCHEANGMTK